MRDELPTKPPPARRSRCAELSQQRERARIDAMSVEDRIKEALSLRASFAWLQPARLKPR